MLWSSPACRGKEFFSRYKQIIHIASPHHLDNLIHHSNIYKVENGQVRKAQGARINRIDLCGSRQLYGAAHWPRVWLFSKLCGILHLSSCTSHLTVISSPSGTHLRKQVPGWDRMHLGGRQGRQRGHVPKASPTVRHPPTLLP